jgi:hypothetical protein
MRRRDDLPTDLPVEWRQVIRELAQRHEMEPSDPKSQARRQELRSQLAEILKSRSQEGNQPCPKPTIT